MNFFLRKTCVLLTCNMLGSSYSSNNDKVLMMLAFNNKIFLVDRVLYTGQCLHTDKNSWMLGKMCTHLFIKIDGEFLFLLARRGESRARHTSFLFSREGTYFVWILLLFSFFIVWNMNLRHIMRRLNGHELNISLYEFT